MIFHFLFSVLLTQGVSMEQKKEACMHVVQHLSKTPEFDIRNFLTQREAKTDKMKLMNYVLYDIFELCLENISEKHLEQALKKDFSHITPQKLGISSSKYKSSEVIDIGFNFITEILKFQTKSMDL